MIDIRSGDLSAGALFIVPVYADRVVAVRGEEIPDLQSMDAVLDAHDFTGKHGQTLFVRMSDGPASEVLLVGLGEEVDAEMLRRAAAIAARAVKPFTSVATALHAVDIDGAVSAVVVGTVLGSYTFDEYKTDPKSSKLAEMVLVGGTPDE